MIFIYLPNILLLLTWLYYFNFNVFLSILLTPLSYLAMNGGLIYYQQFNNVHWIMDKTIILAITENQLKNIILYIVGLINKISYVNKFYTWIKVKFLVYAFNIIVNYIPSQKKNELTEELSEDLKNDYLEILNKNKVRRIRAQSIEKIN